MRDSFSLVPPPSAISEVEQAEALHAMGSFYVRQGFPKQGLALLLAAHKFAVPSLELNRAIAHGYILAGVPQKALALLDALVPTLETEKMRRALERLRARALLALGRVDEAKAAFASSTEQADAPVKKFRVVRQAG